MNAPFDVVIIGAGMSGLAAGLGLARASQRVAILEARERVGGRIYTHRAAPHLPIELGAEFVHGLPPTLWALLRDANLPTFELEGSEIRYEGGLRSAGGEVPSHAHRVLDEMLRWLESQPRGTDLTFSQYLESNPPADPDAAESAARYVEGFNAADRHRIGIAALAQQQRAEDAIEADRLFRVTSGYDAVTTHLAAEAVRSGARLELRSPVHRIEWRRGAASVFVRTPDGTEVRFQTRRVLVTVPLGVLHARSIRFEPVPGEILQQADRLAMGTARRIVLLFRAKFWPDGLSFLFTPAEMPATWWTPMPNSAPTLTGWVGGPKAASLQRSRGADAEEALLALCIATLARAFNRSEAALREQLSSWYTHDWMEDPYSRGAYSYVPAGALDAPERMTRPVEDTLYFAGEHTDVSGHWGTVHAALQSGKLAAERLIEGAGLG